MTCIIGLVDAGKVYIGADSLGVENDYAISYVRKDPKVFKNGNFLIGYTSSFRMGQLLRFSFVPPKIAPNQDLYEYMCTSFIDGVISVLEKNKYANVLDNEISGGNFLVGCKGRLFSIGSDFDVGEPAHGFDAVGSGMYIAYGSMDVLYPMGGISPEDKIKVALRSAAKFSPCVSDPFIVLSI